MTEEASKKPLHRKGQRFFCTSILQEQALQVAQEIKALLGWPGADQIPSQQAFGLGLGQRLLDAGRGQARALCKAQQLEATDRKFNRMRPSMARVLGLETRSAKEG